MTPATKESSTPCNGKTRSINGVIVDYTAGLNVASTKAVDKSIIPTFKAKHIKTDGTEHLKATPNASIAIEDSIDHMSRTIESIFNIHMATPKRSETISKLCASKTDLIPELEAALKGIEAMAEDIRKGLEKRKIAAEIERELNKELEVQKKEVGGRKRKLNEEFERFENEKRRKAEESIKERLEEKIRRDEVVRAKRAEFEKGLEKEL